MKTRFLIIFVIGLIGVSTSVYAEETQSFDVNGYTITTNSSNIQEIELNWGGGVLPSGTIVFDKIIHEHIHIQIPKEMPMTTNLDFGVGFYAIQSPRHAELPIVLTEIDCYYDLEIFVRNSDKIKITSVTPTAGKTVTIVVHDCDEIEIIKLSLKTQIENNLHVKQIECKNENHILSQRSNDKLACVTPYAMVKLQWDTVDNSFWSLVTKNEQQYGIFTHLSKAQNIESLKYDKEMNSVIILVTRDKSEKLSVNVNREILESGNKICPPMPGWDDYFVLINGVEVEYEQRITTDHYRYLEIDIDQQEQSLREMLLHSKEIHKLHDIPYNEDSRIIEIIGACPV